MPRPVTLLSIAVLAGAGVAVVDAQGPYALPETPVTTSAFALTSAAKCVKSPYVVVLKVAAPIGATFKQIDVLVDKRLSTHVAGAVNEGRHQIYIGPGTSEVAIESSTAGGQRVSVSRTYRGCAQPKAKAKRKTTKKPTSTKPKPTLPPPGVEGGGED